MAVGRILSLVLLLIACFERTARAVHSDVSFCTDYHNPTVLNVNVFDEVLSKHAETARRLKPAPFIQGAADGRPAYEFRGSGFHLSDSALSKLIQQVSCATNELTLYTSVFFLDSHTAGPVLQLYYTTGTESIHFPVFGLYLAADSDEIQVAYRHQGKPHTETFSYRLVGGRWRQIAVSFSGNTLQLYVNCVREFSRIVPLPDYCANEWPLMITVADRQYETEYDVGLYAYLQNVGFQFGRDGIRQQCSDIGEECASCGQFLHLVQQAYNLQAEVLSLQARLDNLSGIVVTPTPPVVDPNGRSCLIDDKSIADRKFAFTRAGQICYCRDGNPDCTDLPTDCNVTGISGDDSGNPTPSTEPTASDPDPTCTVPNTNAQILEGEFDFQSRSGSDSCRIYECKPGTRLNTYVRPCTPELATCDPSFNDFQQGMATCCNTGCSECDFARCPDTSVCLQSPEVPQGYLCICKDGYETLANGSCIDRNECLLGRQEGGHDCPQRSVCINLDGNFTCECMAGYRMVARGGGRLCVDINECRGGAQCPQNSQCVNTDGSFFCQCRTGYAMDGDLCQPICDPPCENGGQCVSPDHCTCPVGFTGPSCSEDIDECLLNTHTCRAARSECINTIGSFFCRCQPGFQAKDGECADVDECALKIHNCIGIAACRNTVGSFFCECPGGVNCTGSCSRNGRVIAHGAWIYDGSKGCRNCTCFGGELTCRTRDCNCGSNDPTINRTCCPQCFRRNCVHTTSEGKTIEIRPNQVWLNPDNRCERVSCPSADNPPVVEDLSLGCPKLNCPESYQYNPSGKCCPVCLLPSCDASNDPTKVIPQRNGCDECICQDSTWHCTETVTCSIGTDTCPPNQVLFYQNKCCPMCEDAVLGALSCPITS